MAKHTGVRARSVWSPLAAALITASVLVVAGNAVWASLTASAVSVTPQDVSTGVLTLTMAANGTGFTQPVSNIAPGDSVQRFVDITNSGTLAGEGLALAITASGSKALISDIPGGPRALRVSVATCSDAWTPATGTCSGVVTQVLAAREIGTMSDPVTLLSGLVTTDHVHRLQLTLHLPDQKETTTNGVPPATTIQGQSIDLTYTFTQAQRPSATTTS